MPRKHRNEVLAGAFIVVSSVLFFLVLFLMGSFETLFQKATLVTVHFDQAQGLLTGNAVEILGNQVGKVESVQVEKLGNEAPHVKVVLKIPDLYIPLLTRSAKVLIDKSITGQLTVTIRDLTGEPLSLADFQPGAAEPVVLKGNAAFDSVAAAEKLEHALSKITTAADSIADVIQRLEKSGAIEKIFTDASKVLDEIARISTPLTAKLDDIAAQVQSLLAENRGSLRETLANFAEVSRKANKVLDEFEPSQRSLRGALESFESASRRLDQFLAGNRGYVDGLIRDLRDAANHVEELSAELKRRPWKLLYKPDDGERATLDLYDAAASYNHAASRLHLSVQNLNALASQGDRVDPTLVQKALAEVEASLKRQKEAEASFYQLLSGKAGG